MPTRDQRWFVGTAISYFLRQDYPHRELVIVDDGQDPVGDLVPADMRIRYLRLDEQRPLGAKRNLACQESRGALIAHWDDNAWMRADRLSIQVRELEAADAIACGLQEPLRYLSFPGKAWRYRCLPGEPPWLAGGTLLYQRSAWAAHYFPEIEVGEDTAFVRRLPPERLHPVPDTSFYLALIHPGNAAANDLLDPHWQMASLDEVSRLFACDRAFYAAGRSGATITLAADFRVYDGYGSMSEYLALGLRRAGAGVNLIWLTPTDPIGLSPELLDLLSRSTLEADGPVLYSSWLRPELERFTAAELFIHTMWESSRLPASWPKRLNRARAVLVPTTFVADVCRSSGVTVPIEVVPDGIDPAVYHYEHRLPRAGLITLMVATIHPRKHVAEGIAAWKLAFAGDRDARLIVKSRFRCGGLRPDDDRIRFVDDNDKTRGIAHWYRQADVLLALGSEGFGLPLVEGMATGLPVIALASEGQGDICRAAGELVLAVEPARWEPCDETRWGPCGVRGVPGIEETAARLRWVANHRDEAAAMGRAASAWARRHRNVWAKGPAALDVIEHHVRPRRPLRQP